MTILLLACFSPDTSAQRRKSRHTRIYYKFHYSRRPKAEKQCALLLRKKRRKPKRKKHHSFLATLFGNSGSKSTSMAEIDDTPPPPPPPSKTKIAAKKKPQPKNNPEHEEQERIKDEVLAKNNLPKPTSAQHREIREKVAQRLKDFEPGESITLDPLYFVHDDSEFAVVDMEPFLTAVEYALQGRMILIEGHTDSRGQDNYNVQLSIERVEKIRQLMHDMGVPDERISIVGYGEEVAAFDNTTAEGRQKNRRVDFKVF